MKLNKLADYIFETETYTELDYEFAEKGFESKFDGRELRVRFFEDNVRIFKIGL